MLCTICTEASETQVPNSIMTCILYAVGPGPAPCDKKWRSEHQTHLSLFVGTRLYGGYHDFKVLVSQILHCFLMMWYKYVHVLCTQCLGVLLLTRKENRRTEVSVQTFTKLCRVVHKSTDSAHKYCPPAVLLALKVTGTQCNNSNYIHAPMPILTLPRNKVGAGLEPIQTRLLLERRTSCRGVATLTLWPLPHV